MDAKNCLFCEHFRYFSGEYGYSEMTPGYEAEICCAKELWEWDQYSDFEADFRAKMLTAVTCEHYNPTKGGELA